MRTWIFTVAYLATTVCAAQGLQDISGSYRMETRGFALDSDTYIGPFGGLEVTTWEEGRVIVELSVVRGWPSYNMGDLIDTVAVADTRAVCHTEDDSSCVITLIFDSTGVRLFQVQEDINMGCGFGHAVIAEGYYRKIPRHGELRPWYANEPHDCLHALKTVERSMHRPDRAGMDTLVNSFHPSCLNDVEYREWYNELLFQALDADPQLFLDALGDAVEYWQWPVVLHELAHPVNEQVAERIPSIQGKLATATGNDWLKHRLVRALVGDFE